ncbi:cuticle protein AMP4-like [Eriocheir sinensis]|uniref:cuticle protein AMP4-like n=1 Tax=Eriocheir sinensis TaxID=95602 RepID=UPI0021C852C2|nr:cuticle protein AMP4-like [Eriocheir sinensis]
MRTVAFLAAVALVAAAPTAPQEEEEEKRPILILLDERTPPEGAAYSFAMETENGISFSEVGAEGSAGQANVKGVYRYKQDDGTVAEVRYVADEGGFQPESSLIPVAPAFPHPIPLFVQEQILFAEEQRRLKALEEQKEQEENKAEEEAK